MCYLIFASSKNLKHLFIKVFYKTLFEHNTTESVINNMSFSLGCFLLLNERYFKQELS